MGLVRTLDRWGNVARRPPVWALVASGLFACGGRARRAAGRGTLCYLSGAVVDFHDDLNKRGFTVTNPQAKGTCGCGSSYSM